MIGKNSHDLEEVYIALSKKVHLKVALEILTKLGGSMSYVTILLFASPSPNLPGGELPPMLWRWPVDLLSQKRRKKKTTLAREW